MPTYIMLTKLSPESLNLSQIEENAKKWKKVVEEKCPGVKFLAHYSILGPYDYVSIYEAVNEHEAAKVSLISMSLGAQKAESWTAIPYQDYIKSVRELL